MIALYLFGLYLGQLRGTLTEEQSRAHAQQLAELPVKMEHLLNDSDAIEELSKEFFRSPTFSTSDAVSFSLSRSKARSIERDFLHPRRRLPGR